MLSWGYQAKAKNQVDLTQPVKSKAEDMREYNKAYREKHSGYVMCGCGATFKEISKYTHVKTARHVEWVRVKETKE